MMLKSKIDNWIRKLNPEQEIFLVLAIAFFLAVFASNYEMMRHIVSPVPYFVKMDTRHNMFLVFEELIELSFVFYILDKREYPFGSFNVQFKFIYIVHAAVIYLIFVYGFKCIAFIIWNISPDAYKFLFTYYVTGGNMSLLSIILVGIVNPIAEEFMVVGYVFNRFEKLSSKQIIWISTLIRLSYHTYQGWICLFSILPMGLMLGFYYNKVKSIWPLVLAHSAWDIIPLLSMAGIL